MFYVSVKIGQAYHSQKNCKFQFLNTKKAYSLSCQVQCESNFLAAASCGGIFEKKDVFESNSRLADTLSQQFEDKSLSALRFYCPVEKPGGSVIVISLQMNFFPTHSTPHPPPVALVFNFSDLQFNYDRSGCVFHLIILLVILSVS